MKSWLTSGLAMVVVAALQACKGDSATDGGGGASASGAVGGEAGADAAGAGAVEAERDMICAKVCDIEATLSCVGDDPATCEALCVEHWDMETCQSEARAYVTCAANLPASSWECDVTPGEMGADIKAGLCQAEVMALTMGCAAQ